MQRLILLLLRKQIFQVFNNKNEKNKMGKPFISSGKINRNLIPVCTVISKSMKL